MARGFYKNAPYVLLDDCFSALDAVTVTTILNSLHNVKDQTILCISQRLEVVEKADKILVLAAMIMLVEFGKLPAWIPVIVLAREFIVSGYRLIAVEKGGKVVAASVWGKLKTVTQMISVIFLLLNDFPFSIIHLPVGQIMVWIACIISVVSGIDYFMDSKDMLTESM